MIDYRRAGLLPDRPHTAFRKPDGGLYYEHCFTRHGFDGPFSIVYHAEPPQFHGEGAAIPAAFPANVKAGAPDALRRRHLRSPGLAAHGTPLTGRVPLLFNADLTLGVVRPTASDAVCFANADGDDLFYIHAGSGELRSWFGRLRFGPGDYVLVPRAVSHRFELDAGPQHWFWTECRSALRVPVQYRNPIGQLRMDAPYTHRDFRVPELSGAIDPDGPRELLVKRGDRWSRHVYRHGPLEAVGWDGTVYPFAFPILAFKPKAGQIHLPPTVHGTFATARSLVCSFVPRVVDFGRDAIPCPYPHSNVEVDEVIFYAEGDFTSRKGVDRGSLSYHPAGVVHGPQPGRYESSLGVREVNELAVMIDTFDTLELTDAALGVDVAGYDESWWETT